MLAGLRLHPLHNILVGLALSLFYLQLLSLTEHIRYGYSYAVSSIAITLMISGYCAAVLARWNRAMIIGTNLTVLYAYLYVLLQLEDYALLLGFRALFLILSAVMYLTRRLDWYELPASKPSYPPPPPYPVPADSSRAYFAPARS